MSGINSNTFDAVARAGSFAGVTTQNVAASRALGVTYTNNTGRALQVLASIQNTSGLASDIQVRIDGLFCAYWYDGVIGLFTRPVSFVVPNGSTYQISSTYAASIYSWIESKV